MDPDELQALLASNQEQMRRYFWYGIVMMALGFVMNVLSATANGWNWASILGAVVQFAFCAWAIPWCIWAWRKTRG